MLARQLYVSSGSPYAGTMIDAAGVAEVRSTSGVMRAASSNVRRFAGRKRLRPRSFRATRPASAPAPSFLRIVNAVPAWRGNWRVACHCAANAAPPTLTRCAAARSGAVIRHVVDVSISRARARAAATLSSSTRAPVRSAANSRCASTRSIASASVAPARRSRIASSSTSSRSAICARRPSSARASAWPQSAPAVKRSASVNGTGSRSAGVGWKCRGSSVDSSIDSRRFCAGSGAR